MFTWRSSSWVCSPAWLLERAPLAPQTRRTRRRLQSQGIFLNGDFCRYVRLMGDLTPFNALALLLSLRFAFAATGVGVCHLPDSLVWLHPCGLRCTKVRSHCCVFTGPVPHDISTHTADPRSSTHSRTNPHLLAVDARGEAVAVGCIVRTFDPFNHLLNRGRARRNF